MSRGAASMTSLVSTESVAVERLDTLVVGDRLDTRRAFLKIDTQAYEAAVLDGAPETLRRVHGVELEMSLVPLYEGQLLMTETIDRLSSLGFRLTEVSPGFTDRDSGDTLQVDGIFVRA